MGLTLAKYLTQEGDVAWAIVQDHSYELVIHKTPKDWHVPPCLVPFLTKTTLHQNREEEKHTR